MIRIATDPTPACKPIDISNSLETVGAELPG
jgi:hypothetical protein